MNAAWVRPERSYDRNHAILYCHGGAIPAEIWATPRPLASKLSGVTGWDTLSFEYRLAPEHPLPCGGGRCDEGVGPSDAPRLRGPGRDGGGDSAGGNLALVLCHRLKQESRRLPARLILMSPWTDMTASGKSYTERAELDPHHHPGLYPGGAWGLCPGPGADLPMLSPAVRGFPGFPPTLIQAGSNELLLSDSVRLRDRMQAAGGPMPAGGLDRHVARVSDVPHQKAGQAMASVGPSCWNTHENGPCPQESGRAQRDQGEDRGRPGRGGPSRLG